MNARGIRFSTPEVTTDVGVDELRVLGEELEKIADGSPRLSFAAGLAEQLESLAGPLGGGAAIYEPNDGERFALLRATDHLRNLGHRGKLMTLRDRLHGTGNAGSIAYQLRFVDTRPSYDFASYSLAYEVQDRLVTPRGDELRVVGLFDDQPDHLVVDDWRPAE